MNVFYNMFIIILSIQITKTLQVKKTYLDNTLFLSLMSNN